MPSKLTSPFLSVSLNRCAQKYTFIHNSPLLWRPHIWSQWYKPQVYRWEFHRCQRVPDRWSAVSPEMLNGANDKYSRNELLQSLGEYTYLLYTISNCIIFNLQNPFLSTTVRVEHWRWQSWKQNRQKLFREIDVCKVIVRQSQAAQHTE